MVLFEHFDYQTGYSPHLPSLDFAYVKVVCRAVDVAQIDFGFSGFPKSLVKGFSEVSNPMDQSVFFLNAWRHFKVNVYSPWHRSKYPTAPSPASGQVPGS